MPLVFDVFAVVTTARDTAVSPTGFSSSLGIRSVGRATASTCRSASVWRSPSPPRPVPDELLRNAHIAMYAAKHAGKDSWERFDSSMLDGILERIELESELRAAGDRSEPVVHCSSVATVAIWRGGFLFSPTLPADQLSATLAAAASVSTRLTFAN